MTEEKIERRTIDYQRGYSDGYKTGYYECMKVFAETWAKDKPFGWTIMEPGEKIK